mmetsp:Transcript_51427/g.117306  ORF Transcript_51427/g.117306 Transcript_51427/m.117306 type:complete len:238 (-) Transcript_51427:827-1540(-)
MSSACGWGGAPPDGTCNPPCSSSPAASMKVRPSASSTAATSFPLSTRISPRPSCIVSARSAPTTRTSTKSTPERRPCTASTLARTHPPTSGASTSTKSPVSGRARPVLEPSSPRAASPPPAPPAAPAGGQWSAAAHFAGIGGVPEGTGVPEDGEGPASEAGSGGGSAPSCLSRTARAACSAARPASGSGKSAESIARSWDERSGQPWSDRPRGGTAPPALRSARSSWSLLLAKASET